MKRFFKYADWQENTGYTDPRSKCSDKNKSVSASGSSAVFEGSKQMAEDSQKAALFSEKK